MSDAAYKPARQPRAIVRITSPAGNNPSAASNLEVDDWISWEVTNNIYYEADTFRVSLALSALPPERDAYWFSVQTQIFVEILAGFPADPANPNPVELPSLIIGRADDIEIDPVAGTLTLTGRDLTAVFIDNKITATYENEHVRDIVKSLASSHGLTAVVVGANDFAGTLYKRTQVHMQADRSEWDLLTWLAREEGYACFVKGFDLHFEPVPARSKDPYLLQWNKPDVSHGYPTSNVMELAFSRSLTVSRGISVTARSPSLTKKFPVVESYPSQPKSIQPGKPTPFGGVQNYGYMLPAGQTATQVLKYAEATYRQIVSHEMKLHAELPGDDVLSTEMMLKVQGSGTAFDQTYFPMEIVRRMSFEEGYRMTVSAQNVSPDNAPAVEPVLIKTTAAKQAAAS